MFTRLTPSGWHSARKVNGGARLRRRTLPTGVLVTLAVTMGEVHARRAKDEPLGLVAEAAND